MFRKIAEKGYGYYLTLKILKALFFPVHILLWILYAIICTIIYLVLQIAITLKDAIKTSICEFTNNFIHGRHFKNFKRRDYNKFYGPGPQPLPPVDIR